MKKRLRSGYTTGACAAAAAKAAAERLLNGVHNPVVEIPMVDGRRVPFEIHSGSVKEGNARAIVIKDAGDDPDVTNKAKIGAIVRIADRGSEDKNTLVRIKGGEGVGKSLNPASLLMLGVLPSTQFLWR